VLKLELKIHFEQTSWFHVMTDRQYPDISDILARKNRGRRKRAALSFAEKLAVLDALKQRVEPLVQARKIRRAATGSVSPRQRQVRV
jgi:hypothetical protein